ncbi:MAG: divalent-cation tolerance protein CutA [candidate division Zixibacteria bacterium]|nr:divalent-cation tolerance protein CutA [candidate division Zixibacteria bacterium]
MSYITAPAEVAEQIATSLVKEDLAISVNIIDQVTSIYKWENQIDKTHESLLIVKTTAEKTNELIERVREIHPYEVPEIISVDITGGNPDYLDWLSGKEMSIDDLELDDDDLEVENEESDD